MCVEERERTRGRGRERGGERKRERERVNRESHFNYLCIAYVRVGLRERKRVRGRERGGEKISERVCACVCLTHAHIRTHIHFIQW